MLPHISSLLVQLLHISSLPSLSPHAMLRAAQPCTHNDTFTRLNFGDQVVHLAQQACISRLQINRVGVPSQILWPVSVPFAHNNVATRPLGYMQDASLARTFEHANKCTLSVWRRANTRDRIVPMHRNCCQRPLVGLEENLCHLVLVSCLPTHATLECLQRTLCALERETGMRCGHVASEGMWPQGPNLQGMGAFGERTTLLLEAHTRTCLPSPSHCSVSSPRTSAGRAVKARRS